MVIEPTTIKYQFDDIPQRYESLKISLEFASFGNGLNLKDILIYNS